MAKAINQNSRERALIELFVKILRFKRALRALQIFVCLQNLGVLFDKCGEIVFDFWVVLYDRFFCDIRRAVFKRLH